MNGDSQTLADQCAQRKQVDNGPGIDWNPRPTLYGNRTQACTALCPDGLPFTFTVPAGSYIGLNQIIVDRMAHSYACQLAALNKVCLSTLDPLACLGDVYDDTLIPSGVAPFTFSIISGSLPPGLTLTQTATVGRISGTPTVGGNFTFQIRLIDAHGNFMQKTYSIAVLGITNTSPLPNYLIGTAYSAQLQASGGTAPYTFEMDSGTLPAGLTMSATGLISGTPTTAGSSSFTVLLTDAVDNECSKTFSLTGTALASGWKICNWSTIAPILGNYGSCLDSSILPEWDGTFDKTINSQGGNWAGSSNGDPIWYFLGKSIQTKAVAPDEMPEYPGPDWQDAPGHTFTQLVYVSGLNLWYLAILCKDGATQWLGELDNGDPTNPAGTYLGDAGQPPNYIQVAKINSTLAPTWSALLWAAPSITTAGNGVGSFTPNGGPGMPFDCKSSSPDISNGGMSAHVFETGTMYYTGPAKNGKFSVTWGNSPDTVFGGTGSLKIEQITPDGMTTFLLAQKSFSHALTPPGNYDVPFSLLDTHGDCWKIKVTITTQMDHQIGAPAVAGLTELSGSIVNT